MSCNHKFKGELNLERIDFEPKVLVVGTFIPEWSAGNAGDWFYGRTAANHFWDILPRLYGVPSLKNATTAAWKQFCKDKQIGLTDLISDIDDAYKDNPEHPKILGSFSDQAIAHHFDDFEFVNIVQILRNHPTIKYVYLTRGITESFWRHVWNPVLQYCNLNNIRERRLLTPAGSSLYQHEVYNVGHPGAELPLLEDYILMRWQEEWHFEV